MVGSTITYCIYIFNTGASSESKFGQSDAPETFNQEVVGSIPAAPTKKIRACCVAHRDRRPERPRHIGGAANCRGRAPHT